jgi:hypothetical protein
VLSPLELGARLDRILGCAERLVASLPIRALDHEMCRGDGSVRDLAFRVFRLGLAYVDGMDMGELSGGWLREAAPPDLVDGAAVARYGALVRGRVSGWFEGAGPTEYRRTIATSEGPQNGHALLERITGGVAYHVRRLHAVAVELGSPPRDPLPISDFQGLPDPAGLW